MTKGLRAAVAALALGAVTGCKCDDPCNPALPEEDMPDECLPDSGPAREDFCNSPDEGLNDTAHCVLPLACGVDGGRSDVYINPPTDAGIDQDWYSAQFGTLTPRSLLRVNAGYVAPLTPVALTVSVLRSNAMFSLARAVDDHGQGAPKPIDILIPYTESNSKLLFLVQDKAGRPPVYDLRNPYFISVCTQENPDLNEPNDSADAGATQIPLTQMGAVLGGTNNRGFLATDNDVDRFQFNVPANMPGPRNILYVHITTPTELLPPPPHRISFTLFDPNGTAIAEGVTPNAFLKVNLATAKLVRVPGVYTLVVQGFRTTDTMLIPGDLRQNYTVDVQVLEDLDMNEGNDTLSEAGLRARALTVGGSATITGRVSYVPDPEWFAFDIPASSTNSTLRVKLTAASAAGRFAPLDGPKDRQLRVMKPVDGISVIDSVNNCLTNATLCPKGYDPQDSAQIDLVNRICTSFADAGSGQCLMLERNQHNDSPAFANLRNMEGVVPVPPHAATTRYWVFVGDEGTNWADDVAWTLDVALDADPDEDLGARTGSLPGTINGVLTYGYGRTAEYDLQRCGEMPDRCQGIRSPYDYDAVVSDFDTFSFNLGLGGDRAWGLQWEIDKVDGGTLPAELRLDLAFCGTVLTDGGCSIRTGTNYQTGNFSPWYSNDLPDRVVGWRREDLGNVVRVTAELNQCLCFQSAFTRFTMSVGVVDRNYYAPMRYRVSQTTGPWTGVFPGDAGPNTACARAGASPDGGMVACRLP